MTPEQQALLDFMATYDEAVLKWTRLDLSMYRLNILGWVVIIFDGRDRSRRAVEVIHLEEDTREEVCRAAEKAIRHLFLS